MPTEKILKYPHPILKKHSHLVEALGPQIHSLVRDLIDTMVASPGCIGLAAPQIGVSLRVCVVDVSCSNLIKDDANSYLVLINPEILASDGACTIREGCISVPDYTGDVSRASTIMVRFVDCSGEVREISVWGLVAVEIQHAVDHLDGILFLDRVTSISTELFRRQSYS